MILFYPSHRTLIIDSVVVLPINFYIQKPPFFAICLSFNPIKINFTTARYIAQLYYSSWVNSAIHMLAGLEEMNSASDIANRINVPTAQITETLELLRKMKLIKKEKNHWKTVNGHTHLSRENPMTSVHHSSWRQRANLNCSLSETEGIHYTSIQSHSYIDFEKLNNILMQAMDESRKSIQHSPDEDVSCICIDLFRI